MHKDTGIKWLKKETTAEKTENTTGRNKPKNIVEES